MMKNIDMLKVAKGVGLVLSIGGTILTSVVAGKENEKMLEKLVDQKLGK